MSDIFISYAKEDRPRAQLFAVALARQGWSVFWDRTIVAGRTWRGTIGKELESARCVVVLWSPNSNDSDWVLDEADDAKRRQILVPDLIADILPPLGFRGVQAANLSHWDGTETDPAFHELVKDIATHIGPSPREVAEERQRAEAAEAAWRAEEERKRREIEEAARQAEGERLKAGAEHLRMVAEEEKRRAEEAERLRQEAEAREAAEAKRIVTEVAKATSLWEEGSKREEAPEPLSQMEILPVAVPSVDPPKKIGWPLPASIAAVLVAAATAFMPAERGVMSLPNASLATTSQPTKRGFESLKAAAESGDADADALYRLATVYDRGEGVAEDKAKAATYYRSAANKGSIAASLALGVLYEYGFGVNKDPELAKQLYEQAANHGNDEAAGRLGELIAQGNPGSYTKACGLLRRAALADAQSKEKWKSSLKWYLCP